MRAAHPTGCLEEERLPHPWRHPELGRGELPEGTPPGQAARRLLGQPLRGGSAPGLRHPRAGRTPSPDPRPRPRCPGSAAPGSGVGRGAEPGGRRRRHPAAPGTGPGPEPGSGAAAAGGGAAAAAAAVCPARSGGPGPAAMFKNTFQSGFLSVLYSIGSKPLQIWDKKVRNGHIKRITDNDIQSLVLEIEGTNVSTTYITCPADPKKTLGIKLPFLVMIIKNLKKYFTFEVQVLDDKNVRRRFRASNYQSTTRVKPFICTMPMRLDDGWNQIQFNLSDFTRRAYGTNYIETLRVQIHANCRIRRVYFSDRLYSEDELPAEFKLYLPVQNKAKVS
uniref:Cilia and flagella associated protein 20 n=52 Tax=Neognathae TaxID=8825 RepID=U3I0D9_ANAPP